MLFRGRPLRVDLPGRLPGRRGRVLVLDVPVRPESLSPTFRGLLLPRRHLPGPDGGWLRGRGRPPRYRPTAAGLPRLQSPALSETRLPKKGLAFRAPRGDDLRLNRAWPLLLTTRTTAPLRARHWIRKDQTNAVH